jgi:hypothetical protein
MLMASCCCVQPAPHTRRSCCVSQCTQGGVHICTTAAHAAAAAAAAAAADVAASPPLAAHLLCCSNCSRWSGCSVWARGACCWWPSQSYACTRAGLMWGSGCSALPYPTKKQAGEGGAGAAAAAAGAWGGSRCWFWVAFLHCDLGWGGVGAVGRGRAQGSRRMCPLGLPPLGSRRHVVL